MNPPSARGHWAAPAPTDGFSVIELLVAMVLAGILMATAVVGMHAFLIANRQQGTADGLRSSLRSAAERSLAQGQTVCVKMTSTTWTLYVHDCTVAANKIDGPHTVDDPAITLAPNFPAPATPIPNQTTSCSPAGACAYFYPRGTALKGSVTVARSGGRTYTINVEGLTARVSFG